MNYKVKKIFNTAILLFFSLLLSCSEKKKESDKPLYELSYWVDMDLSGKHGRGYWYDVTTIPPDPIIAEEYIANACKNLSKQYGADKLYVIYHRQYEFEDAKKVFTLWKKYGEKNGIEVVPTVVLQSYSPTMSMNFNEDEIISLVRWSLDNINNNNFGVYDVYTRDQQDTPQDKLLTVMNKVAKDKLVMVGMQPGVKVNSNFSYVVQDTWTAACQGRTNELWENPIFFNDTDLYGRKLLEEWVMERVTDSVRTVWDLIPVAWDYETDDELSYICPGDDAYKNDAPIPGRHHLCHKYIINCYESGINDTLFGGYSCDLHILEANSAGRGETPSFYQSLKNNIEYNGDFAETMKEIGNIYKTLIKQKNK